MPYFKFNNNNVYYNIVGEGIPLLLLHGNTVSSKMFNPIFKLYSKNYKVISLDLPGHGKSSRLDKFETDFWFYNSQVCFALLEKLKLDNVSVIGTSGGALIAINLCLEFPERVNYLFADSFLGDYPLPSFINSLKEDREKGKNKFLAKIFWFMNHGLDWKKIVDLDTEMQIEFSKKGKSFFHKSISELKVPTLLIGSLKDEYCDNIDEIYGNLGKKNSKLKIHLFETGNHPALLSNKNDFYELVNNTLKNDSTPTRFNPED